jgi:hypothetical protein
MEITVDHPIYRHCGHFIEYSSLITVVLAWGGGVRVVRINIGYRTENGKPEEHWGHAMGPIGANSEKVGVLGHYFTL